MNKKKNSLSIIHTFFSGAIMSTLPPYGLIAFMSAGMKERFASHFTEVPLLTRLLLKNSMK